MFFSWKFFLTDSGSHVLFWPVLCVCTLCRQNLIGIKLKLMQIDVFIIFQMKTEIMTLSFLLSSWSIGNVPRNDETSMYFFYFGQKQFHSWVIKKTQYQCFYQGNCIATRKKQVVLSLDRIVSLINLSFNGNLTCHSISLLVTWILT